MKKNIIIIGSGLSGPLLSTILSKNSDLRISVFERSSDPRKINKFSGRSINLALSRRGIEALRNGDYEAVGRTMSENQIMLNSIGVSSPELDNLIKAAAPTSLGAKLTGAGGGGCMVALTKNPKLTSDAIELAGGRTLISKLGSPGMKIDSAENVTFWTKM